MDTLEIPRFELMNCLPYCLLEEALEFDASDLLTYFANSARQESRISSYIKHANSEPAGKLQSLISSFDFEKEVSEEISKILQAKSLYEALFNSIMNDHANSLNDLLQDTIG
jgi:hypothetical protein